MSKQHQTLVPSIFAPLIWCVFQFVLRCATCAVGSLGIEKHEVHILCQGSSVGQEGIGSVFFLLVFRMAHCVYTCITQVAAHMQRPCPSNTRRWFRQFLVIYRCLDKGGGVVTWVVCWDKGEGWGWGKTGLCGGGGGVVQAPFPDPPPSGLP